MGLGLFLLAAFLFGPPIYQFVYFANNDTISKVRAFIYGLGYWAVLVWTLLMPILVAAEYGIVATVITSIIALALTGGIFYLIYKKRCKTLAEDLAIDCFIVVKEMIACLGMLFGVFLMIFGIGLAIFLPGMRRRD